MSLPFKGGVCHKRDDPERESPLFPLRPAPLMDSFPGLGEMPEPLPMRVVLIGLTQVRYLLVRGIEPQQTRKLGGSFCADSNSNPATIVFCFLQGPTAVVGNGHVGHEIVCVCFSCNLGCCILHVGWSEMYSSTSG